MYVYNIIYRPVSPPQGVRHFSFISIHITYTLTLFQSPVLYSITIYIIVI